MKKIFLLFVLLFCLITPAFSLNYKFNKGYVSDDAGFLGDYYSGAINNIYHNLKQDSGVDVLLITIANKGDYSFEDVEKELLNKYKKIGGANRDKWVMIILTRTPYQMDIRRGEALKNAIPNTLKRALGLEFWIHKMLVDTDNRENIRIQLQTQYVYGLASYIAEVVADEYHTSVVYTESINLGSEIFSQSQNFPRTDPVTKFLRKYNLFPAAIIFFLGIILPLYIKNRRRYKRRYW